MFKKSRNNRQKQVSKPKPLTYEQVRRPNKFVGIEHSWKNLRTLQTPVYIYIYIYIYQYIHIHIYICLQEIIWMHSRLTQIHMMYRKPGNIKDDLVAAGGVWRNVYDCNTKFVNILRSNDHLKKDILNTDNFSFDWVVYLI